MEVGAIQVPINPKGSVAEIAGFVRQVRPALIVTDPELVCPRSTPRSPMPARPSARSMSRRSTTPSPTARGPAGVDESDVAVMIPTSGTTGRSKLVMQTHLAYVMAGEGFPFWMQLTADDRLMTSLAAVPHQRAGVLDARVDRTRVRASRSCPASPPARFLDDARRFGATEFNSIGAMLEILVRQPPRPDDADNPIRRCYTGPSPDREHQLEIEERFGFEIVCGYALSESPYALIWRHGERPYGTLGSARQHPVLGHVNDARAVDDGRVVGIGRDRRARAAESGDHARLLRDARGDRGGDRRRLAANR